MIVEPMITQVLTVIHFKLNGTTTVEARKQRRPDGTDAIVLNIPFEAQHADENQPLFGLRIHPGASNLIIVDAVQLLPPTSGHNPESA